MQKRELGRIIEFKNIFKKTLVNIMPFGQLIIGPAGCGKSTYCSTILQHGVTVNRQFSVINLDPAAEHLPYDPVIDVRTLISVNEAMTDIDVSLGPNGALVYCLEFLANNLEWLDDQFEDLDASSNQYFLIDCPGQFEIYTHYAVMSKLIGCFEKHNLTLCSVFVLDSNFVTDASKFLSASLVTLTGMIHLGLPHINLLTKWDLVSVNDRNKLKDWLDPNVTILLDEMYRENSPWLEHYRHLTEAFADIIQEFGILQFYPFHMFNFSNVQNNLYRIDKLIKFDEEVEVTDKDFDDLNDDEDTNDVDR